MDNEEEEEDEDVLAALRHGSEEEYSSEDELELTSDSTFLTLQLATARISKDLLVGGEVRGRTRRRLSSSTSAVEDDDLRVEPLAASELDALDIVGDTAASEWPPDTGIGWGGADAIARRPLSAIAAGGDRTGTATAFVGGGGAGGGGGGLGRAPVVFSLRQRSCIKCRGANTTSEATCLLCQVRARALAASNARRRQDKRGGGGGGHAVDADMGYAGQPRSASAPLVRGPAGSSVASPVASPRTVASPSRGASHVHHRRRRAVGRSGSLSGSDAALGPVDEAAPNQDGRSMRQYKERRRRDSAAKAYQVAADRAAVFGLYSSLPALPTTLAAAAAAALATPKASATAAEDREEQVTFEGTGAAPGRP